MWESRTPPNILSDRGHREVAPSVISEAFSRVGLADRFPSTASVRRPLVHRRSAGDGPGRRCRPEAGAPGGDLRCQRRRVEADEVNEVTLVGRMSQPAEEQVLPSGTELWKFRVIVGRPPSPALAGHRGRPGLRGVDQAAGPIGRDVAHRRRGRGQGQPAAPVLRAGRRRSGVAVRGGGGRRPGSFVEQTDERPEARLRLERRGLLRAAARRRDDVHHQVEVDRRQQGGRDPAAASRASRACGDRVARSSTFDGPTGEPARSAVVDELDHGVPVGAPRAATVAQACAVGQRPACPAPSAATALAVLEPMVTCAPAAVGRRDQVVERRRRGGAGGSRRGRAGSRPGRSPSPGRGAGPTPGRGRAARRRRRSGGGRRRPAAARSARPASMACELVGVADRPDPVLLPGVVDVLPVRRRRCGPCRSPRGRRPGRGARAGSAPG